MLLFKKCFLCLISLVGLAFLVWIILYYLQFIEYDNFIHLSELIKIVFAIVGACWILFEYYYKREKQKNDHVRISVSTETLDDSNYAIKTSIENPTLYSKEIKYAFVLISPFKSDFLPAINKDLLLNIENTNSLYELKNKISDDYFIRNELIIIPLTFYFKENVRIGNELLTYSLPLGKLLLKENQNQGALKKYDIRFFVFRDPKDFNNYHRVNHCTLITDKSLLEIYKELEVNPYHLPGRKPKNKKE